MGRLVRLLVGVVDADGLAELAGGMSLHVWLQHQARCTHGEAREVLGAVEVLRHMPATLAGLADRLLALCEADLAGRPTAGRPTAGRPRCRGTVK